MKRVPSTILADALRGFFSDYLPRQRALSFHTLQSYRDSLKLLLQFVAGRGDPSLLDVENLTVEQITTFLQHLEAARHNQAVTRNVRLSAIHCFFRYVSARYPEHLSQAQRAFQTNWNTGNTASRTRGDTSRPSAD